MTFQIYKKQQDHLHQ